MKKIFLFLFILFSLESIAQIAPPYARPTYSIGMYGSDYWLKHRTVYASQLWVRDTTNTATLGGVYVWTKRTSDLTHSGVNFYNYGAGIGLFQPVLALVAPAMTTGQFVTLTLGRATNTGNTNESFLSYRYINSASDSNALMFSFANNNRPFFATGNNRIGINQPYPAKTFHVTGAVRLDSLVIAGGTDTTTYKPMGISATGEVTPMSRWPSSAMASTVPAGNYGNVQLNRNGAFATPGTDSVDFESATGLRVKGAFGSSVGIYAGTLSAPSAKLHIAAGSTSAGTAPIRMESGALNSTKVAGQLEYNGNHYITNNAVRQGIGGTLAEFYTDTSNTSTTQTTLYSYTLPTETVTTNGDGLEFEYSLSLNDATFTATILIILNNTAFSVAIPSTSSTGVVVIRGKIIKVGSNTGRVTASAHYTTANGTVGVVYPYYANVSSLSFDVNQAFILAGTASGATGGTGDITARTGSIKFIPHANN